MRNFRLNSRLHTVIGPLVAGLCCAWTVAAEAQSSGWVERAGTGPSTAAPVNRAAKQPDQSKGSAWHPTDEQPSGRLVRPTWSPYRDPPKALIPNTIPPEDTKRIGQSSRAKQDAARELRPRDPIKLDPFGDSNLSSRADGSAGRSRYNLAQRYVDSGTDLHYECSPTIQPSSEGCGVLQDFDYGDGSSWCSPYGIQSGPSYDWPACTWVWGRAEYLLWWTKGSDVPALVTTSPDGTAQANAGVLGQPETSILFGSSGLNADVRSGGRFTIGCCLEPTGQLNFEGSYLFLGASASQYDIASPGSPILARPFLNIENGLQEAHLLAFPDWTQGSISARATNSFQAANGLFRVLSFRREDGQLELLAGYRFCRLEDKLRIDESLQAAGPTTIDLFDCFDTKNEFHGVDLGVAGRYYYDRWSLDTLIKVAIGNSQSTVFIDGATEATVQGSSSTTPGGFLAQPTNMGTYVHNQFAMVPELGLALGYEILPNLRATLGYTLIYWSKVARPGDQIDTELNLSQLPPGPLVGPAKPQFRYATTDFWAHGMNFGLEYRY